MIDFTDDELRMIQSLIQTGEEPATKKHTATLLSIQNKLYKHDVKALRVYQKRPEHVMQVRIFIRTPKLGKVPIVVEVPFPDARDRDSLIQYAIRTKLIMAGLAGKAETKEELVKLVEARAKTFWARGYRDGV